MEWFGAILITMTLSIADLREKPEFKLTNTLNIDDNENEPHPYIPRDCKYFTVNDFSTKLRSSPDNFSILSINIRSLGNKMDMPLDVMDKINSNQSSISIIAIQEVWTIPLNNTTPFNIPGYKQLIYKQRDNTGLDMNSGGGVGFWVHNSLQVEIINEISIFDPNIMESIFIKVKFSDNKYNVIGNI